MKRSKGIILALLLALGAVAISMAPLSPLWSQTALFSGMAYASVIWAGLFASLIWTASHPTPKRMQQVARDVLVCGVATYLSCVVGYLIGSIAGGYQLDTPGRDRHSDLLMSAILLPFHAAPVIVAMVTSFVFQRIQSKG
jgi:hypothetical protein